MNALGSTIALGFGLLATACQTVWGEQAKEQDSVYKWGRWAVLSPAAGGEPYVEALAPDAANNARPGEASEFQPELASVGGPVDPTVPVIVPNPPGTPPPTGDPRDGLLLPPVVTPNPPGAPPTGDPRDGLLMPPVATPNPPGALPPGGDPRDGL
mgnify:CR=1 FL=1